MNHLLLQYSYLQVLDFLTTVAFLLNGVHEGNPVVQLAIIYSPSPLGGLAAVKIIAIGIGIFCWKAGKTKLLSRINVMFAVVVAWNLAALIAESAGRS